MPLTNPTLAALIAGAATLTGPVGSFSNGSGVSFGVNGNTITASVSQSNQQVTLFATGNTTQSSTGTSNASSLIFRGQGVASVGITNGSIVIDAPAGAPSPVNVSAGTTSGNLGSVVFSNSHNVSFGLNGATITATATVATSLTNVNLSAGTTSQNLSGFVFSNSNNVSFGLDGSTVTATATQSEFTHSGLNPYPDTEKLTAAIAQGTFVFDPIRVPHVQFDRIIIPVFNTNTSNSSGSHTLSFWVGVYSKNASTLSLVFSASRTTAVTHSGTQGSYSLYSGQRLFTIPHTTTLTQGDYWLAFICRTTSGGANGSYSLFQGSNIASDFLGHFGSSHNTTMQLTLGQGVYSATTSSIPSSVAFSQLRGSDSTARRAIYIMFGSGTV